MSEITVEEILDQIARLPPSERIRLRRMLDGQKQQQISQGPPNFTGDRRVPPIEMPDGAHESKWLAENARQYAGQWVALDGDRLIAHEPDSRTVYAAARDDGAYLPMVTFVEDPDNPVHIIWK